MTADASFAPRAAAIGSRIRIVGTGMAGVAAVTVGGVSAAFTVSGDTDLLVTIPPNVTGDEFGVAEVAADGAFLGNVTVGSAGPWTVPGAVSPFTIGVGLTAGAARIGIGSTFADACSRVGSDGPLDVPAAVATIGPNQITTSLPRRVNHGNWQVSQASGQFQLGKGLLTATQAWAAGISLPDAAIGVELDLTTADQGATVLTTPTLAYAWQNVIHGGAFYPYSSGESIAFEGRVIPAGTWAPGGVPVNLTVSQFTGAGSFSVLFTDTVNGGTAENTVGGSVDVSSSLSDVPFGAFYHGGALAVVALTGAESSGTEPVDDGIFAAANLRLSLSFGWQPPRWRPIFKVSRGPLRYYPRDDAAGGSPRTNRSSTSRQSSARQGWTNTYR